MTDLSATDPSGANTSPLMTANEAASYLTVKVPTLNKLRRDGKIRATYIFSDARYHREDLDEFISAARSNAARTSS